MKTRLIVFLLLISVIAIKCEMYDQTVPNGSFGKLKEYEINDTVKIDYQDTIKIIPDDIIISFDTVLEDSRCPINAMCVWAGRVKIEFTITIDGHSTSLQKEVKEHFTIGDYYFELVLVNPYPELDSEYTMEDYNIDMLIIGLDDLEWTEGAVVDKTGLDGCGLVVKTSPGKFLEPVSVPNNTKLYDGQEIKFKYINAPGWGSICMVGDIVKILQIDGVTGCLPIVYDFDSIDVNLPGDRFEINSFEISGDCLSLSVSYSGGCKKHQFKMIRGYDRCATPPVPPPMFYITHNANGDMCEAYPTKNISFDLTSLQVNNTNNVTFTIVANNGDFNETLEYVY